MQHRLSSTPWGVPQDQHEIMPGMILVSTASHGGFRLGPDLLAKMPSALRSFKTYAGPGWYEEDCDWAVVALAFPDAFTPLNVLAAVETVQSTKDYFVGVFQWLNNEGRVVLNRALATKSARGAEFRAGSCSTGGDGWRVHCRSIAGTESVVIDFPQSACSVLDRTGYYALPAVFTLEQAEQHGGKIVKREPVAEQVTT